MRLQRSDLPLLASRMELLETRVPFLGSRVGCARTGLSLLRLFLDLLVGRVEPLSPDLELPA
jgi:hypothetical protein